MRSLPECETAGVGSGPGGWDEPPVARRSQEVRSDAETGIRPVMNTRTIAVVALIIAVVVLIILLT